MEIKTRNLKLSLKDEIKAIEETVLLPVEKKQSDWNIKAIDGQIEAINAITGRKFVGSMFDFNKMLRD